MYPENVCSVIQDSAILLPVSLPFPKTTQAESAEQKLKLQTSLYSSFLESHR